MLSCNSCGHTASFGIRDLPPDAVVLCESCGLGRSFGSRPFPVSKMLEPLVDPRDGARRSVKPGPLECASCGLVPVPFRLTESSEGLLLCEECYVDRMREHVRPDLDVPEQSKKGRRADVEAYLKAEPWCSPEYEKMVILTMCLYDLLKDDPAEYISQRQIAEAQLKHFLGRQITAEAGNFLQQTGVVQLMGPEEVGRLMQDLGVPLTRRRRGANGYKTEAIREALNRLKPGILI